MASKLLKDVSVGRSDKTRHSCDAISAVTETRLPNSPRMKSKASEYLPLAGSPDGDDVGLADSITLLEERKLRPSYRFLSLLAAIQSLVILSLLGAGVVWYANDHRRSFDCRPFLYCMHSASC